MKKRLLSLLLTLCMVMSLVPVTVLAAEGDIDITEVNINGVTGELWSHSDAPFASVDDGANYTVESQKLVFGYCGGNQARQRRPQTESRRGIYFYHYT